MVVRTLQRVKMAMFFFVSRGERSDELTEKLMEVGLHYLWQKLVTKLLILSSARPT